MHKINKEEIKQILTDIVEQTKKVDDLNTKLEIEGFGENADELDDDILNERVNNFYKLIHGDYELHFLYTKFKLLLEKLN